MKIKTENIEFISFNDGICDIYSEDEEGNKINKYKSLGFSNRVLGYNRVFAAKSVQIKANAIICIPNVYGIDTHDTIEIKGKGTYNIELIQNKFDTNPKSIDLTLSQLEMHEVTE